MTSPSRAESLRWRLNRLRRMGLGEVAHRTGREARHRADDLVYARSHARWERKWQPPASEVVPSRVPRSTLGFLRAERAAATREADPEGARGILEAAEVVMEGRYGYVGHAEVLLPSPIDYRRDPFTDRQWPTTHAKRLDYRNAPYGDPKWIWELNRLQELPLLAAGWLLSGEPAHLDHASHLAGSWLDDAEPGRGVAWSNGYEAGLRAISLSLWLDAVRGTDLVTRELRDRMVVALWQHAKWIERDPSTHSSANNHRVGELVGLVAIGLLVPELRSAERWLRDGLEGLTRESALQIAPDGSGVEQAFAYHLHTLDLLLLATALLDSTGRAVPAPLRAALTRSADALSIQLGAGEPDPRYGDDDGAWVVRLTGTSHRDGRSRAADLAAYLGHPGARRTAGDLDVTARWLFGEDGARRFEDTTPGPEPGSALLPDAGIVVLRSPGRRVLFDVGPLGYLSIAAHGHADALSVTIAHDGIELVADPGVGSYFASPERRAVFRGTAAHATVAVDGQDQSESGGPFLWRAHARATLLGVDVDRNVALAEHDGYERLRPPVRHRRLVVATPGGPVVVHDRISGTGDHAVVQSWPLHPSLEPVDVHGSTLAFGVGPGGAPVLRIAAVSDAPLRTELSRGGEPDPARGWYSEGLEHIEPAWSVGLVSELNGGTLDIVCAISVGDDEDARSTEIEIRPESAAARVRYRVGGDERVLELDLERPAETMRRLRGA